MAVMPLGSTVFLQPITKVLVLVSMTALQLSLELYLMFPSSTVIFSRLGQKAYGLGPMELTLFGMNTVVNPSHLPKASFLMVVTEPGISKEVSLLQLKNANSPMVLTELPIDKDVKLVQSWKALFPIVVTELGIVMEDKPVQQVKAWRSI